MLLFSTYQILLFMYIYIEREKKPPKVYIYICVFIYMGFPGSSAGEESACNAGDLGLIPG